MIYIFSAFYAEAKNIIDHYGLKKEKSPEMVRFDVFANESIRLVITGVGEINAAAAVSNIGGAYGISPDDEILNVGCGAGFSSDICMGSIFLGNKLTEQMTGRTFYPDMLMKANFRECEIVTVARVLNEGCDSVVYDMEAAAVYQAAAFFVGPHRMHFIKLVSDAGERIDQSKITELFALQEEKICGYIDMLLSVGGNKTSIDDKNHFSCYTFNMYSLHAEKRNLLFRMEIKKTSSLKRNRKSCKVQIKNLLIKFLALQMPPRHGQLLQCDSKSSQPCKNKILLRHFCGQKKAA